MHLRKTLIFIGVAFVIIGSIIAFDMLTRSENYLVCTYEIETYKEKMTFEFYEEVLIKFYREEFAKTNVSNQDSLFAKYKAKGEAFTNNQYLSYTAVQEEGGIKANTYIYLPMYSDVFEAYFDEGMEIKRSSSKEHIKKVFEDRKYKCEIR
jgi:hypothetical protein